MTKKVVSMIIIGWILTNSIVIVNATALSQTQSSPITQNINFNEKPPKPIRQPAQFEPIEGVIIKFPFVPLSLIKEMAEDIEVVTIVENEAAKNFVKLQYMLFGIDLSHCSFLFAETEDFCPRDWGPQFIFNGNNELGVVDLKLPYYSPQDKIPTIYGNWQNLPVYQMNIINEGGDYMTDGQGIAISTDYILSRNKEYTRDEIGQMFSDYFGINTYHLVPVPSKSQYLHIDVFAKLLSPDTIMIIQSSTDHPYYNIFEETAQYFENQTSCYGTPYNVVRIYTHMYEPYINSLILNNKVLVPINGNKWDDEAIESYQNAMPGYEVLGFRYHNLYDEGWKYCNALHCRTIEIPDREMLYIQHTPLSGIQINPAESDSQFIFNGYEVVAKITPYSGEEIISDLTRVYWKIEDDDWNFIKLEPKEDGFYHATIPSQEAGTKISYYIHAEDESGRSENHPYIGAPGAHSFYVINAPSKTSQIE